MSSMQGWVWYRVRTIQRMYTRRTRDKCGWDHNRLSGYQATQTQKTRIRTNAADIHCSTPVLESQLRRSTSIVRFRSLQPKPCRICESSRLHSLIYYKREHWIHDRTHINERIDYKVRSCIYPVHFLPYDNSYLFHIFVWCCLIWYTLTEN